MRKISKKHKEAIGRVVKKMHKEGKYPEPWNKGKTKKTDNRILDYSNEKKTGKYKKCIVCGSKYWAIPSHEKRRKFCSYACYNEYTSEYRTGSNSPSWKGGKTKKNVLRTTKKYKYWRKYVFQRDNFTCVMCKKVGGNLEAHHILPRRLFPELWDRIDNGITLCQKCHHSIKNREMEHIEEFRRWTAGRCLSI
jgi:5-methylcytosine-specific restriction endonuclease McrA